MQPDGSLQGSREIAVGENFPVGQTRNWPEYKVTIPQFFREEGGKKRTEGEGRKTEPGGKTRDFNWDFTASLR